MIKFKSFLAEKIDQFLEYRRQTGYIHVNNRWIFSIFDNYVIEHNADFNDMTPGFFLEFRRHVPSNPGTANQVILHLRHFFDYLVRTDEIDRNPLIDIPLLSENSYIPFMFSPDQVEMFLASVRENIRRSNEKLFLKDLAVYTAFLMMARSGLRISEPLRIRDGHFRSNERTIYIEKTKFNKDRLIPVTSDLSQAIENFISVRTGILGRMENPLMLTVHHGPVLESLIYKAFHPTIKRIGIEHPRRTIGGITFGHPKPHSFRHSFAVNTLKKASGKGRTPENVLPILAAYLGHSNYKYTMKYLKVLDADHLKHWVNFCVFKKRTMYLRD